MLRRLMPRRRERMIGSARGKRRYDLPLNKGSGTGFLVLLVGLMTFLAMLAIGASFTLSMMQKRWSSGLENRFTIEIPADHDGRLMNTAEITEAGEKLAAMLKTHPVVSDIHILSQAEIQELVKPWLGDSLMLGDMPLPGLIAVTMNDGADDLNVETLRKQITATIPHARLDTHQGWLNDVLRFTGALKFAATLLILTIGITTFTAVSGAVRARMDIYRAEVELLHLMGATDRYIARQFQRYAFYAAIQGALIGAVIGAGAIAAIGWMAGRMDLNLLPDFSMSGAQVMILTLLPLVIGMFAMMTARRTVMRVLTQMP